MLKKALSWISIFILFAITLTGCMAPSKKASKPLRVEYTQWEGDYTLIIAQEKGFFAKHGVQVQLVYYPTFSKAIPDLSTNKFDIGLFGIGDLLMASRVAKVRGVAVYDGGGTSTLVSKSSIPDLIALHDKRIGVNIGSSGELFVREMLKSAGMTVQDVTLVNVDPENVPELLTSGEIDAGYVWAPLDMRAVEAGHKILYSRSKTASLFPDIIVAQDDIAHERPEALRAFLAAWFEAVEYRLGNQEESSQMIARVTNQPVKDVALTGTVTLYTKADNLRLFDKSKGADSVYSVAETNLDFSINRGDVTIKPDLDQLLDSSFIQ